MDSGRGAAKIPRTLNLTVDPDIGDSWPDLPAEIESDIGHEKTKCSQVNTIVSIRGSSCFFFGVSSSWMEQQLQF